MIKSFFDDRVGRFYDIRLSALERNKVEQGRLQLDGDMFGWRAAAKKATVGTVSRAGIEQLKDGAGFNAHKLFKRSKQSVEEQGWARARQEDSRT